MSGIFGYIGKEEQTQNIRQGLSMLYRRGCKSTGITLKSEDKLYYSGSIDADPPDDAGYTSALAVTTDEKIISPACNGMLSVVCDGHIENFPELATPGKSLYEKACDSEIILGMLNEQDNRDMVGAIRHINEKIKGNPTYAVMSSEEDAIYLSKGSEPLFVGICNGEAYISSELSALFKICDKFILLSDGDTAKVTAGKVTVFDMRLRKAKRQAKSMPMSIYSEGKHIGTEEIIYCPSMIKECCNSIIKNNKPSFENLKLNRHSIDRIKKIILTGSNSAYYVAKANAYNLELLTDIECVAIPSSELMHSTGMMNKETLVVAISDRGEDMNTIKAVKRAKYNESRVISLTSNKCSYLALISDDVIDTGYDFTYQSDALTSFQAEYFVATMLGIYIGHKKGYISGVHMNVSTRLAQMLSGKLSSAIKQKSRQDIISAIRNAGSIAVTGFAVDYCTAKEISGKLRTLGGFCSGAFMPDEIYSSNDDLIMAIISNEAYFGILSRELEQAKTQGKKIIICTTESIGDMFRNAENVITFGDSIPLFNPITISCGIYKIILDASQGIKKLDEVS